MRLAGRGGTPTDGLRPPAHIACGATTTDDGRPMSTNVELIGENLMIQQYIGEITDPDHCRIVSSSDVFTPAGRTTRGEARERLVYVGSPASAGTPPRATACFRCCKSRVRVVRASHALRDAARRPRDAHRARKSGLGDT
jgi:hypothetical protein